MTIRNIFLICLTTLLVCAFAPGVMAAPQASLTLKNSDVALCNKNDTEWSLTKEASAFDQTNQSVTWTVTATKGATSDNFILINGFVAIQNTGTADATIGNIVVNLQRNQGTGAKQKWVSVSSDVSDATSGDGATTAGICSGASSEGKSFFSENAASGELSFIDADNNDIWAITPEKTIPPGETVNLLFSAQFDNTVLGISAGEQIRAEVIVSFGNVATRGGSGATCTKIDVNGNGVIGTDENNVRSVPTRITKAVPALNNCNSTVTLQDSGVVPTGSVTLGNVDYQGYEAGNIITDTATFTVTASAVDGGVNGGQICNEATLRGESCGVEVIIGYNTILNPDGTTTQEPITHYFSCCTGEDLKASACVDVSGIPTGFNPGDYCTYTQGGWGSKPNGNNPGQILATNFSTVYPGGVVEVGIPGDSGYTMKFETALVNEGTKNSPNWVTEAAPYFIQKYLPAGGTASSLSADLVNPTSSSSGVFGGQVLALQLNVDFNNSGITAGTSGSIANLKLCNTGTSLDDMTVSDILGAANTALGGGALPDGYTVSGIETLVDIINNAFDNCEVVTEFATLNLCR